MASQAQAELYLRLRAAGIGDASRELSGLARTATAAGREFRALQEEAGAGQLYRKISREASQATAELTRLQRVTREGRTSVFFSDLTGHLQGAGRVGAVAFGTLTAGIGGYVRAGMQGTAESLQLSRAMQEISLQVASVFTPQIHAAIDAIQRLANWMRNLTGEQQHSAREWVAGALALSGFLALLPRVTGGLAALTRTRGAAAGVSGAARAAGAGLPGMGGLPGVGGLPVVGGLLGGFGAAGLLVGLAAASEEGRRALVELATATAPLVQGFGGLVTVAAKLAAALAFVVDWALHLPGGGRGGGVSVPGAAGLGAAGGGIYGALKWGAAGTTVLGMGLTGALLGAPIAAAAAGISNAISSRVQNRTDVETLRQELREMRPGLKDEKLFPFQRDLLRGEIERREARIKELEGPGKPKDQLTPFTPGFESPADLYRRIAEVASGQNDPAKETADNTKAIADTMRQLIETLRATGLHVPLDRKGDA